MIFNIKSHFIWVVLLFISNPSHYSQCCAVGNHRLKGNTQSVTERIQLHRALGKSLRVVQIGDSHTQPGILNIPASEALKRCMSDAGHGNAFPYQVAKTNGHDGYKTESNVSWQISRLIQSNPAFPLGLSGYTIYTQDRDAEISWDFDTLQTEQQVQRITLFHESTSDSNYFYQLTDYNGNKARYLPQISTSKKSVFEFNEPVWNFTLSHLSFHDYQKSSTLEGVYVENGKAGVVYSSIGINGATYSHFLQAENFRNQLESIQPDIIIVSLGTNEAFQNEEFRDTLLYTQMDEMIQMLTSLSSQPELILTTPPAVSKQVYKKGKSYFIPHPNVPIIRNIILEEAEWNQLPVFDWYEEMGGENSMKEWAQRGLTDKKQIHFSPSGYREIGQYLGESFCALIR